MAETYPLMPFVLYDGGLGCNNNDSSVWTWEILLICNRPSTWILRSINCRHHNDCCVLVGDVYTYHRKVNISQSLMCTKCRKSKYDMTQTPPSSLPSHPSSYSVPLRQQLSTIAPWTPRRGSKTVVRAYHALIHTRGLRVLTAMDTHIQIGLSRNRHLTWLSCPGTASC